ncbi:glycosyltransferase [Roseomonas sp. KE2513]|uniref:glycosyltransferase n=1 Tax=Roseomonas sp. KE2513 TaxID=2479202 RepID=UPI0018DFD2AB|nr:glycosyltransferase [Roseomonas sp. KE2513]MBI0535375.1 glycosyltransferase [Roseomonas sp. KE2513]
MDGSDSSLLDLDYAGADEADPVSAAVARGMGSQLAPSSTVSMAESWVSRPDASAALDDVLRLIARYPTTERLQILALRLLERLRERQDTIGPWRALLQRFQRNHDAMLVTLRWTLRNDGPGLAAVELARHFPEPPTLPADTLLLARALEEIGEARLADAAFDRLVRSHPAYEMGWLIRAQVEERRGRPWAARDVIDQGAERLGPRPRLLAASARIASDLAVLDRVVQHEGNGHAGSAVLASLIRRAAEGREAPPSFQDSVGDVVMVGASLGAGGAERQMVTSAVGLHGAHLERRRIGGHNLGQVRVICRSTEARPGGAFFLPVLERHGVGLWSYAVMPEHHLSGELTDLHRFLSPRVAEATARLTHALQAMAPSVVHLWQDGTILACSLAALLAGVPRIVLSVRTAPPPDRPGRDSPEYASLYPLLASIPGVTWTSNSRFAAARYAQYIGMDPDSIRVVPNGIAPLSPKGSSAARALMAAFDAACPPGLTIGAVMRFDENKRPLEFIDFAATLLARRPDARFILIGDGPLRASAEARAACLGGRILFTGRCTEVGYWLSQMDCLVLLSRFEGMPNVVLEAQLAGVPAVATPAGGTSEAILHGETGFLLESAETLRSEEITERVLQVMEAGGRAGPMSQAARRFVTDHFSVDRMLEGTVESYAR